MRVRCAKSNSSFKGPTGTMRGHRRVLQQAAAAPFIAAMDRPRRPPRPQELQPPRVGRVAFAGLHPFWSPPPCVPGSLPREWASDGPCSSSATPQGQTVRPAHIPVLPTAKIRRRNFKKVFCGPPDNPLVNSDSQQSSDAAGKNSAECASVRAGLAGCDEKRVGAPVCLPWAARMHPFWQILGVWSAADSRYGEGTDRPRGEMPPRPGKFIRLECAHLGVWGNGCDAVQERHVASSQGQVDVLCAIWTSAVAVRETVSGSTSRSLQDRRSTANKSTRRACIQVPVSLGSAEGLQRSLLMCQMGHVRDRSAQISVASAPVIRRGALFATSHLQALRVRALDETVGRGVGEAQVTCSCGSATWDPWAHMAPSLRSNENVSRAFPEGSNSQAKVLVAPTHSPSWTSGHHTPCPVLRIWPTGVVQEWALGQKVSWARSRQT
ncbi:hypothetical protein BCR34DRAFT_585422 [Clohesyomyces aquaticus]|uniref:Uncharacterized protein n=1 Tax=Clohesyomyces aquaticus TaxID=1231657 RepID=A0A1Y1ZXC5_9PLEO|nr:hypothetical protein BCR34DRAFT_585422 [Clohesyomyces aquaticus]